MLESHRRWHARLWWALGPLLLIALIAALATRSAGDSSAAHDGRPSARSGVSP